MGDATQNGDNKRLLAANVRRARVFAGLSQQALADALGLDRSAISKIETGHRRLESLELQRISRRLGRPPAWFLSAGGHGGGAPQRRLLSDRRSAILALGKKHGARNFRLFGSVARGDAGPESDIDLLVDLESGRSLMDHAALILELRDLLGCDVDVITEAGLNERLKPKVMGEAIKL